MKVDGVIECLAPVVRRAFHAEQLGKTRFMAGDAFSYGDIPVGVMIRRYMELVPERPKMANLERWFGEISKRGPFQEHCGGIPLT